MLLSVYVGLMNTSHLQNTDFAYTGLAYRNTCQLLALFNWPTPARKQLLHCLPFLCVHVCVCVSVCLSLCVRVCVHLCVRVCVRLRACLRMRVCACQVCVRACICTCVCGCVRVRTHVDVRVCVCGGWMGGMRMKNNRQWL